VQPSRFCGPGLGALGGAKVKGRGNEFHAMHGGLAWSKLKDDLDHHLPVGASLEIQADTEKDSIGSAPV
jgi:hypothetical protein